MNEVYEKISKAVSDYKISDTAFNSEDRKKTISDILSSFLQKHATEYEVNVTDHPEQINALLVDIRLKPINVIYKVDPIVYNES